MSARCAVQCVVVLLALSLSACGGSDPTAPPAAAAAAPAAHHHGHLRHSEYLRLKRVRGTYHDAATLRAACRHIGHSTMLMTQVDLECRTIARLMESWKAAGPASQACVAQRSPECVARVIDRLAARLERLVRADHALHVAAVARGLPHACRAYLQARPHELAQAKRQAESLREMSAEVEGGVPRGVVSAIGRYNAAARWANPAASPLKQLKRCARA